MIDLAVVDDEVLWQNRISKMLEQLFQEEIRIHLFSSGQEFLAENHSYDVVFFDVELGNNVMDGLELCRLYKEKYSGQEFFAIILTTHTEFMRRGYLSNAFRYIDKRNLEEELAEAVHSIELNRKSTKYSAFQLKKLGRVELRVDTVVCVETEGRKIALRMRDGENYYLDEGFNMVVSRLEPYGFYMIRKGVLVNMKYIIELKDDYIILKYITPKKRYYISRRRYNDFICVFTEWRMERALG